MVNPPEVAAAAFTSSEAVFDTPFQVAVRVAAWSADTAVEVAVKVAETEPAATVTEDGTVSAAALSLSETTAPPLGAAPLRLTVQVALEPPVIEAVLQVSDERTAADGAFTVTAAVFETPPREAVIVATASAVTAVEVAVKTAVLEPAATVTEDGTVSATALSLSETAVAAAAGALSETVQLVFEPPLMVAGLQTSEDSTGAEAALMVTTVVFDTPLKDAVMVAL